ncbi:MAG: hypothetical protein V4507_12815, partial [Verrucomicrobiota bacterium]
LDFEREQKHGRASLGPPLSITKKFCILSRKTSLHAISGLNIISTTETNRGTEQERELLAISILKNKFNFNKESRKFRAENLKSFFPDFPI